MSSEEAHTSERRKHYTIIDKDSKQLKPVSVDCAANFIHFAGTAGIPKTFITNSTTNTLSWIPPACAQCTGGYGGGEVLCGDKYTGIMCSNCVENYGKSGKFCIECPKQAMNVILIMIMGGCGLLVVAFMTRNTIAAGKQLENRLQQASHICNTIAFY